MGVHFFKVLIITSAYALISYWACLSALKDKKFNKTFLGKIPIHPDVGKAADNGKPLVEENTEHKISKIYLELAKKIKSSFL